MTDLHTRLITICGDIACGEYEKAKAIFELAPDQVQQDPLGVLAEALAMMLVRIEAREFELSRMVDDLSSAREELLRHRERLSKENSRLRQVLRRKAVGDRPLGSSPAMLELLRQAERAALTDTPLLITGETGTGKSLFARHVHALSERAQKPFVAVNCAAIPSSLLESELFGIEAGVASGVQARVGRFEQASGGTLLLDEIGDMPLESQVKLLQVLETGLVERVGGRKPVRVGVRVMAATHRDLERCVAVGSFRADLFYRLHVLRLHIPPLRQRREDIPLLVKLFVAALAERLPMAATGITAAALTALTVFDWPGNIRQLQNALERAALLATGSAIDVGDLALLTEPPLGDLVPLPLENQPQSAPVSFASAAPQCGGRAHVSCTLEAVEAAHIREVLAQTGGNKSLTARMLGISREGLRVKLERMKEL